jgi:hypothetical protein
MMICVVLSLLFTLKMHFLSGKKKEKRGKPVNKSNFNPREVCLKTFVGNLEGNPVEKAS